MVWTNVSKPSTLGWNQVNSQGRENYDDTETLYDDLDVYYDGLNPGQWNSVAKPVSSVWTKINKPT